MSTTPAACDVVFYHQWMEAHPLAPSLSPAANAVHPAFMTRIAVAFARRHAPGGRVCIVTDDPARFGGGFADVVFEQRPAVDPGAVALDRARAYRDFVAARVGTPGGALFIDTDALVLRDPAPLFAGGFDVALTYQQGSVATRPEALDHWGLPTDGRLSAINGGVMAARYTPAAVAFHDATLARFAAIVAEGERFLDHGRNTFKVVGREDAAGAHRIADVRIWGGHQFALTSLLSDALFGEFHAESMVGDAHVLLLPDDAWNYSPPPGRLGMDMLDGRWILHLKGTRKTQLAPIAAWFGIG
ncbi:MAG: hypothetical protein AB7P02_21005 [Alphaproteobacteria bacterium]